MLIHLRRNAVAYLALFVALGGSSYAAFKLGRNAVKTVNIAPNAVTSPKVKNGSLTAADFAAGALPAGAKGDTGAPGAQGAKGDTGAQGPKGDTGAAGASALSTLPAGSTESGAYAIGGPTPGPGGTQSTLIGNVSFPIPLAAGLDGTHVVYNDSGATSAHCPGAGHADSGFLCLYETNHSTANGIQILDSSKLPALGASRWGFLLTALDASAPNPSVYAYGVWSVTA